MTKQKSANLANWATSKTLDKPALKKSLKKFAPEKIALKKLEKPVLEKTVLEKCVLASPVSKFQKTKVEEKVLHLKQSNSFLSRKIHQPQNKNLKIEKAQKVSQKLSIALRQNLIRRKSFKPKNCS